MSEVWVALIGLAGIVAGAAVTSWRQARSDNSAERVKLREIVSVEWQALSDDMQERIDKLQARVDAQDEKISALQIERQSLEDRILLWRRHVGVLEEHIDKQLPPPPPPRPIP